MLDPYWFGGTTPLWTTVALGYCLASVYLKAFDAYDHPPRIWGTFLLTGTALFLLVNHQHLIGDITSISTVAELLVIAAAASVGILLFLLARERARILEQLERYQDEADTDTDTSESDNAPE